MRPARRSVKTSEHVALLYPAAGVRLRRCVVDLFLGFHKNLQVPYSNWCSMGPSPEFPGSRPCYGLSMNESLKISLQRSGVVNNVDTRNSFIWTPARKILNIHADLFIVLMILEVRAGS